MEILILRECIKVIILATSKFCEKDVFKTIIPIRKSINKEYTKSCEKRIQLREKLAMPKYLIPQLKTYLER